MNKLCDGAADCTDESDENVLKCSEPVASRLVGGNNVSIGRLEVKRKGVWGTVCSTGFSDADATVACKMLGLDGTARALDNSAFGPGEGPIWIHEAFCRGKELSLSECSLSWSISSDCSHANDVGVECIEKYFSIFLKKCFLVDQLDSKIFRPTNSRVQCGKPMVDDEPQIPIKRIASGMEARPGAQPWVASVRVQGRTISRHHCGAAILSELHVLTVAHCMEDYPYNTYRIRVGDWDKEFQDYQEQEFEVETVHFHEEYGFRVYLDNDIAVVKLKPKPNGRGIRFGERVLPVCLPRKSATYGHHLNCTVAGWGTTGSSFPRFMQVAALPYIDTSTCIAPNVYGPRKITNSMFCAGFLEGGKNKS